MSETVSGGYNPDSPYIQQLRAAHSVLVLYNSVKEYPDSLSRLSRVLMLRSGNRELYTFAGNFRAAYESDDPSYGRVVGLGLSASHLYHHILSNIREGYAPVISPEAFSQLEREANTDRDIEKYIQRELGPEALDKWRERQIDLMFSELDEPLTEVILSIGGEEGLEADEAMQTRMFFAAVTVNRLFLIQGSLPD